MVGELPTHFDQTPDQPLDTTPNPFATDVEFTEQVQEIERQKPHLQPGLVGLKAMATCFVPVQCILALLDPVFQLCPAIVDLDYFLY